MQDDVRVDSTPCGLLLLRPYQISWEEMGANERVSESSIESSRVKSFASSDDLMICYAQLRTYILH